MQLEDEFGDIISKARKGKELSLDDVSEQTEISNSRLIKLESYKSQPNNGELIKLSSVLGLKYKALADVAFNNYLPSPFDFDETYNGLKIIPIKGVVNGYGVWSYIIVNDKKWNSKAYRV